MPFIVTTSRPAAYRSIGPPTIYRISRQAVTTLEEARATGRKLLIRLRSAHYPNGGDRASWIPAFGAMAALPESGGTITLPDGTVIEVMAVDDEEYARAIDAGMNGPAVPGVAEGGPVRSELERIEQLLVEIRTQASANWRSGYVELADEALALVRGLLAEPQEDAVLGEESREPPRTECTICRSPVYCGHGAENRVEVARDA